MEMMDMKIMVRTMIFFILITFTATLIACQPINYDTVARIESWEDRFDLEEGTFLIYYYHPDCPACKIIEREMFIFVRDYNDDIPMYFLLASPDVGTPPADIGVVPTLVHMNGNQYVQHVSGIDPIRNYLHALTNVQNQRQ